MLLLRSLLLLSVFSLVSSCKSEGPNVTVCLLDADRQELQCAMADGTESVIPLPDAMNYVCLSPSDFSILLNYMKDKCK